MFSKRALYENAPAGLDFGKKQYGMSLKTCVTEVSKEESHAAIVIASMAAAGVGVGPDGTTAPAAAPAPTAPTPPDAAAAFAAAFAAAGFFCTKNTNVYI